MDPVPTALQARVAAAAWMPRQTMVALA
jgi:hypothetical protein